MQVDRAHADRASAGQRDPHVAGARQQRPQHEHRGAHRLDQLVRRVGGADPARFDHRFARPRRKERADVAYDLLHRPDVGHVRQVRQAYRFRSQQGGGQARKSRVLGSGGRDLSLQPARPLDDETVHPGRFYCRPARLSDPPRESDARDAIEVLLDVLSSRPKRAAREPGSMNHMGYMGPGSRPLARAWPG